MPKVLTGKKATSRKITREQSARKVIYENVSMRLCVGKDAITSQYARELLGWEEETEANKFGSDYLLKDLRDVRVRCANNVTNRPLYSGKVRELQQEHLRKRWWLNGEPIIVGRTGLILNGQHTLISLILADQAWAADKDRYTEWKNGVTCEKKIVFGISEEDQVVNTMDTCKPRSLADVIYRSEYFAQAKRGQRVAASRATDYAIRLLWHRTGASMDAFGLRRTHSESLDFLNRHPRLLECVKHVMEEEGTEHQVSRYVSVGYAAALMYLMATCGSNDEEYLAAEGAGEKLLDFSHWDKASDFWVLLASGSKDTDALRKAMASSQDGEGGLSNEERWAFISKAWCCYRDDQPITAAALHLKYHDDEDGGRKLMECPTVGGIDLGDPSLVDESRIRTKDPTPEQIERRKQVVKNGKSVQARLDRKGQRKGDAWSKGDTAWVNDPEGEHYFGTLQDDPYECDGGDVRVMIEAADGTWDVGVEQLCFERPADAPPKPMPQQAAGKKPEAITMSSPGKTPPKKTAPRKASSKGTAPKGGELWWVNDGDEPWQGRVVEVLGNSVKLKVQQGFLGAGSLRPATVSSMSRKQPGT